MSTLAKKRFIIKTLKLEGYKKDYRLNLNLPSYLHQVLIGLLLSDGSLEKPKLNGGARFSLNLSLDYAGFLFHIYNLFEPYVDSLPNIIEVKNRDKVFNSIRFKTVILPSLDKYYNIFYQFNEEKRKVVKVLPKNIIDQMTPIVLAYMIMGDGNYNKEKKIIRIYTNNFTKAEVEILAEVIYKKLDIYVRVQHDRRQQYILVIEKNKVDNVRKIIKNNIHPSMIYRIGLTNMTNKLNYEKILEQI